MALRVCAHPGCPALIPAGSRDGRCPNHQRARDAARGRRQERGYDAAHDRLRADYQRRMNEGHTFTCWRCNKPVNPDAWHLGHCDNDRSKYHGPEHIGCNTAARGTCKHVSHM